MEEVLKPIIVSMFVTVIFIYLASTYLKPMTGYKNVDDFLTYMALQRGQIAHAAVMVGVVTLFTDYILESALPE